MNNPELSDPVRLYAPWRTLLHESLRHGRLPFWDPYVFAGTPFVANSQAAIFYPPNLLYGIASVDAATTILLLAHLWVATAGMYLLARFGGLEVGIPAALLAAVGYGFGGFAMVWFEFPTFMAVYAWMPWSVLAMWRLARSPSTLNYAGLAITVGLAALGGQIQIFQYQLLALGLILFVACLHLAPASLKTAVRRFALGATGLGAGLVLGAIQLLPTLEAGPLIVRGREPLEGLITSAFPLRLLPLVALPRAYGSSQLGDWFAPGNENEYVAFCGVICLFLAPLALAHWRNAFVQALLAVEALAWGIALGTPLFTVLYHVVPLMNQVRAIGRATVLHSFAAPLLAAIGLEVLLRLIVAPRTRRLAAGYLGLALLGLIALFLVDRHVAHGGLAAASMASQYLGLLVPAGVATLVLAAGLRRTSWLPALAAVLPLLLFGELYLAYGLYNTADPGPPTLQQPTSVTSYLQQHPGRYVAFRTDEISGNTNIAYHLPTIDGSDSFILRAFADYFNLIEPHEQDLHLNAAGPLSQPQSLVSPLVANIGVNAVVTDVHLDQLGLTGPGPGANPRTLRWGLAVESGPDRVYALSDAGALLRPVSCLRQEANEVRVMGDLSSPQSDLVDVGFTSDPVPAGAACPRSDIQTAANMKAKAPQVTTATVDMFGTGVATMDWPSGGTLVFAESYYPGWRVDIDGRTASLLRIDHALMGAVVPAGHHTATFSYHPTQLGAGVAISGIAIAALGVILTAGEVRRRRARPRRALLGAQPSRYHRSK